MSAMIILFFIGSFGIEIGMGSISTKTNPLMYKQIPGFRASVESLLNRKRSILEHQILIPFTENTTMYYGSIRISTETYQQWKSVENAESFIRFTYQRNTKRIPLFDPSTRVSYVFTDFKISVAKDDPDNFFVEPVMSYKMKEDAELNVTFNFKLVDFNQEKPDSDYSSLFALMFCVFSFILITANIHWYNSKFPVVSMLMLSDIWRISPSFRYVNFFASFGIQIITSCILMILPGPSIYTTLLSLHLASCLASMDSPGQQTNTKLVTLSVQSPLFQWLF